MPCHDGVSAIEAKRLAAIGQKSDETLWLGQGQNISSHRRFDRTWLCHQKCTAKRGKFNSYTYFVYDTPQIPPLPEKPDTEKPDTANQYTTKERDYSNSVLQSTDSHKSDCEMFDKFWDLVAHKQAKPQCKIKFNRAAKTTDPETIIKAYQGQLTEHRSKGKGDEYFRRPLTWLNQEGWLDPFEAKDIADTRASRAKGRVRNWQKTGYWHENWGFPPDHPGAMTETKEALREMQHGEKKQSKGL